MIDLDANPPPRKYNVTQTRQVMVTANSAKDAGAIAAAAFKNGQNSGNGVINGPTGVYGNTTAKITEVGQWVEEVR